MFFKGGVTSKLSDLIVDDKKPELEPNPSSGSNFLYFLGTVILNMEISKILWNKELSYHVF